MEKKYTVGIDFGSLSARAVLVDTADGQVCASAEHPYPHAVMTERDINGAAASATTALQHPGDYIESLGVTVRSVLESSGVGPESVAALALDFTASNILPTLGDGTSLALLDEFKDEPHAYVKMWKHHGAYAEAEAITDAANKLDPAILLPHSGKCSSEWAYSKMYETLNKAPRVYERAELFLEAGDWLTYILTGTLSRSACMVGYKALWNEKTGYPCNELFASVDKRLSRISETKMRGAVLPLGAPVGALNRLGASLTGLCEGTVVASSIIDAHAALPSAGAVSPGDLMIIMGTSACHILISDSDKPVPGICGRVQGGVVPGYAAYESGQCAVGDALAWFMKNALPAECVEKAAARGLGVFDYMNEAAEALSIGESGLIALDWWNGNRTPYADFELSGLIIGLTLTTPPEAIYRAIVESIAFGAKRMVDAYCAAGVTVRRIIVGGGIAKKNAFIMQTLANVLGMDISVTDATEAGAVGSAIYAAVAAGIYSDVGEASQKMSYPVLKTYHSEPGAHELYMPIYEEYVTLGEYFHGINPIMRKLRKFGKQH